MRLISLTWCLLATSAPAQYRPAELDPPQPVREFRAAWIASVWNVDWPSGPGLSPAQQREELIRILEVAAQTRLNAIIFQVRPEADALYSSKIEPWSYWLTGQQGKAPGDGYDPLAFAVREAHARGMELHAWFNPFRARSTSQIKPAALHVTRKQSDWLLPAGSQVWLNPALPAVRERAIAVVSDVAKRYDIDGVHIDDYFYPYPKDGKSVFDDSKTYASYRANGGRLGAAEWRRTQIDGFVKELGGAVHRVRPDLKFGVSPFGIWRPGNPASIEAGIDSCLDLAADSRLWLREGWVDYLSPQLYWRIDQEAQSFGTLVRWWSEQNGGRRHVWPGIASSRIRGEGSDRARRSLETVNQIALVRKHAVSGGGSGHAHWSMSALMEDRDGVRARLTSGPYAELAVVPEMPWLEMPRLGGRGALAVPDIAASRGEDSVRVEWKGPPRGGNSVRWWVVQTRGRTGGWTTAKVLPGAATSTVLRGTPSALAVRAVDSVGRISGPACLVR
jgi:uncharacterized lipoprotein YddW (UPF0748 family)